MHNGPLTNMPSFIQTAIQMEKADSRSQNGIQGPGMTNCVEKVKERGRGHSSVSLMATLKFPATIYLRYPTLCLLNLNHFPTFSMYITRRKKQKCVYFLFVFQNFSLAEKHFIEWKFQGCNKIKSHRLGSTAIENSHYSHYLQCYLNDFLLSYVFVFILLVHRDLQIS